MKRTILGLVIVLLFVIACQGPPEQATLAAEAQIVTATPAPISSLDFSAMVITPGDLPAGYKGAGINLEVGDLPPEVPPPDAFFSQKLSYNDEPGGNITILMYEDELKISQAYDSIVKQMPAGATLVDIGEIGMSVSSSSGTPTAALTYIRCQAVLSIQWVGTSNVDDLLSYAVNLNKRLSPYTCRGESHD